MLFGVNANFKDLQISRNAAKLAGLAINSELYIEWVPLNNASHKLHQSDRLWGLWNIENNGEGTDLDQIEINLMCHLQWIKTIQLLHIQEWQMTS